VCVGRLVGPAAPVCLPAAGSLQHQVIWGQESLQRDSHGHHQHGRNCFLIESYFIYSPSKFKDDILSQIPQSSTHIFLRILHFPQCNHYHLIISPDPLCYGIRSVSIIANAQRETHKCKHKDSQIFVFAFVSLSLCMCNY